MEGRKPKTKAMEYLIMNKFLKDYFIPHSFSVHSKYYKHLKQPINAGNMPNYVDHRMDLHEKWISKWRYQPLWKVRDYFGEKFAFYFAWSGHLITHLWMPVVFGAICFGYGVHLSIWQPIKPPSMTNLTDIQKVQELVEQMLDRLKQSFDNAITPIFAGIICIWGTVFTESWKRLSNRLAFEWDVSDLDESEPDRPQFIGTEERVDPVSNLRVEYFPFVTQCSRFTTSAVILIFMLMVVFAAAAAIILCRAAMTVKVCPGLHNKTHCLLLNVVLPSVLNALAIIVLGKLYDWLAVKLTDWENHRTQSAYNSALIVKLFCFQFVNSYTSLVYIAFIRGSSGITVIWDQLGFGPEYDDKCGIDNNCMSMLSFQVLVLMLMKPIPKFFMDVVIPICQSIYSKYRSKFSKVHAQSDPDPFNLHSYLQYERQKPPLIDFTISEYMEKVLQYGYLVLFAASFPLAPAIAMITNLIDLRVDAHRLLWMYRRPVPFLVPSIGIWQPIVETLNVLGVISNSFIIAFTSSWGRQMTTRNKLILVLVLEHGLFGLKFLLNILIPDIPQDVKINIRREKYYMDLMKDKIDVRLQKLANQNLPEHPTHIPRYSLDKSITNFDISSEQQVTTPV